MKAKGEKRSLEDLHQEAIRAKPGTEESRLA